MGVFAYNGITDGVFVKISIFVLGASSGLDWRKLKGF
jgi:hypothetical protein